MILFTKRDYTVLLLIVLLCSNVFAASDSSDSFFTGILSGSPQSPYQLQVHKEVAVFASGISLILAAKAVKLNIKDYSETDLAEFSKHDVNSFDRIAIVVGAEGSMLMYRFQNNWFETNKLGMTYGISYEF